MAVLVSTLACARPSGRTGGHRGEPARGPRHLRFRLARQGPAHGRAHPRARVHVLHVDRRAERQGRDARVPGRHRLRPHAFAPHRRAREAGRVDRGGQQQVGGSGPVSRRGGARRPDLRPDMGVDDRIGGSCCPSTASIARRPRRRRHERHTPRERWDEQLPLGRWLEAVASPQPLPAGGRVASIAGAFAAALVEKIGRIVLRSPKRIRAPPGRRGHRGAGRRAAPAAPRRGRGRRSRLRGRHGGATCRALADARFPCTTRNCRRRDCR